MTETDAGGLREPGDTNDTEPTQGRRRTWAPGSAAVLDYMVRPGSPAVSPEARLVYLALFSHWGTEGTICPSVTRMAQGIGLHRATIIRKLSELVEAGLVKRSVSHGRHNVYQLQPPWNQSHIDTSCSQQLVAQNDGSSRTEQLVLVAQSDPKKPLLSNPRKKPNDNAHDSAFELEFTELWAVYPRRVNRSGAWIKYVATRKKGATAEELLTATRHYAQSREGEDPGFTLHAATFFGPQRRWQDFVNPPDPAQIGKVVPARRGGYVDHTAGGPRFLPDSGFKMRSVPDA